MKLRKLFLTGTATMVLLGIAGATPSNSQGFPRATRSFFDTLYVECFESAADDVALARVVGNPAGGLQIELSTRDDGIAGCSCSNLPNNLKNRFKQYENGVGGNINDPLADLNLEIDFVAPSGLADSSDFILSTILNPNKPGNILVTPSTLDDEGGTIPKNSRLTYIEFENEAQDETPDALHTLFVRQGVLNKLIPIDVVQRQQQFCENTEE